MDEISRQYGEDICPAKRRPQSIEPDRKPSKPLNGDETWGNLHMTDAEIATTFHRRLANRARDPNRLLDLDQGQRAGIRPKKQKPVRATAGRILIPSGLNTVEGHTIERLALEATRKQIEKNLKIQRLTSWLIDLAGSGGLHCFELAVKKNDGAVSNSAQACRRATGTNNPDGADTDAGGSTPQGLKGGKVAKGGLDVWVQLEDDFSIQSPTRHVDDGHDGREHDDVEPMAVQLSDRRQLCFTNGENMSTWTSDYDLSETNRCHFRLKLAEPFVQHIRTLLGQPFNTATETRDGLVDIVFDYAFDAYDFAGIDRDSDSDSDSDDETSHEAELEAAESADDTVSRTGQIYDIARDADCEADCEAACEADPGGPYLDDYDHGVDHNVHLRKLTVVIVVIFIIVRAIELVCSVPLPINAYCANYGL